MNKKIQLLGTSIEYTHLISKRAKRIRLVVYPGGEIKVTTPVSVPEHIINSFINSKAKWIIAKYEQQKKIKKRTKSENRTEYLIYKKVAMALAKERIGFFNKAYGFNYNKVSIKNNSSLWGSCSRKGNLNFLYKIALLPSDLADYIIVHELCHLKEFNHSQNFWNLVALTIPDHKQRRAKLKSRGQDLQ
ncbi:MAG: M48 family metallopeptidase [Candidatus Doudnabacteria bacterium]|nr:M48 family metallopeptidase [Candidatus Doudnabacteria bacterium]